LSVDFVDCPIFQIIFQIAARPKFGKLNLSLKNAQIGGIFAFFGFLKWIPIGASFSMPWENLESQHKDFAT